MDWRQFIMDYPGMRLFPHAGSELGLKGRFAFRAQPIGMLEVTDEFELLILVPNAFPRDIPRVKETGRRIPNDSKYHVNQHDSTLCLGSPMRLLCNLSRNPTLVGFAETCIVPYLYAMSRNLNEGIPFVFGELQHGTPGELNDYADLLGLKNPDQARKAVKLLGMKQRCANKHPCPCGCGRRLGCCDFRVRLSKVRELASLEWFRSIVKA